MLSIYCLNLTGNTSRAPKKQKLLSKKPGKKGKATRPNYMLMDSVDYATIRQSNWYRHPQEKDIEDPFFWCMEQKYIYDDIYKFYQHPIRPMQPYKMGDIMAKPSYAEVAHVLEHMGMVSLMEKQCPYNIPLVLQFFSTLVIEGDHKKTMKWMSSTTQCTSSFDRFADLLGYTFSSYPPIGHRMHNVDRPNKNVMKDMYGKDGIIGKKEGLLPLYDKLVIILRSIIAPSGGNNDNVVAPVGNLLCLAKQIIENEDPTADFKVDVMDFIYHEMFDSMVNKLTIPYAPYIMLLIKDTMRNHDFSKYTMQPHSYKRVYQKRKEVIHVAAAPTARAARTARAAPASGSFMGDARRGATRPAPAPVPSFAPPQKPNWFRRYILCMNADIRRGQYETYLREENILKHLPRLPNDPPAADPLSYEKWNEGSKFPWAQLESHLLADSAGPSRPFYTRTHNAEDDDDESEDNGDDDNDADGSGDDDDDDDDADGSDDDDEDAGSG